jgi:hypothetical protein
VYGVGCAAEGRKGAVIVFGAQFQYFYLEGSVRRKQCNVELKTEEEEIE